MRHIRTLEVSRKAAPTSSTKLPPPLCPLVNAQVRFPLAALRPLPAAAGHVCCWAGNTIHFGSACETAAAASPRVSLACTFRVAQGAGRLCGALLPNLTRDDARGLTLEGRLRLVAQSLLLYSQWYRLPASLPLL